MAEHALMSRIRALVFFRALFVTLLLGSAFLFKIEYFYANPRTISSFIITLYLLTIVYSLIVGRVRNLYFFVYVQLVLDVCAEIILVSITGGVESLFSFALILTVLSSSIVVSSRAGYIIASLSSILYGLMVDLQFYRLVPFIDTTTASEKVLLYAIFVNTLSYYITAYLGGYLSRRLAKTEMLLEEQDTQLKDLELFNSKVIESLPSGLFTTDIADRILIFNRAAEKITGLQGQEIIGEHIGTALPFLPVPLQEGRRDVNVIVGTAEEKIIGITISALRDTSGKDTGYIGVFQDLTQLKKLEAEVQQKEKWAAIGELSSNIAHEIRNPLASMKGSIEMLRDPKIPDKHKERLMNIALHEMERLDNIVTDFLTYSRPRPLEMKRIDLHLLLDETLCLLRNMGVDKNTIGIVKDFNGQLVTVADPQQIRQVFWNLGMNAIEAMRTGGRLTVRTRVSPDSIRISFEDTGVGICTGDIGRIFYPFFTTKDAGTGLGLSIAYRIVEEHQGTIAVSSIPGIKTIFTIILNRRYGEL